LRKYHGFVPDLDQIREVSKASVNQLSFNAAIDEVSRSIYASATIMMLKHG
jgi:hypothetical protein